MKRPYSAAAGEPRIRSRESPESDRYDVSSLREQLARTAASLIVEQEIDDWQFARRKAAKMLGIENTSLQPDRQQLEAALREYVESYLADEQAELVSRLRAEALDWMEQLSEFEPVLTGFIADGWAYPGCEIRLEILADNAKIVEIALLNRDIDFIHGRVAGPGPRPEILEIEGESGPVRLVIQDLSQRRNRKQDRTRLKLGELQELLRGVGRS